MLACPNPGVSQASEDDPAAARARAADEWAALAPLIAGQPRVRLSKDGGRSYRTSNERPLDERLPSVPAAVRIVGRDGRVAALCLDLDTSRGDVAADYEALSALLRGLGARFVADVSPNGGCHVYVPFSSRIPFTDAREVVEALGRRFPTIDPGPHQNAAAGCIRTPGSPHKRGGYQRLMGPLGQARAALATGNTRGAFERLRGSLQTELAASRPAATTPLPLLSAEELGTPSAQRRQLPPNKEQAARTGEYDRSTYSSPSEARQAVLASAAAAGWTLSDVLAQMHKGIWSGMTAFYARYGNPTARSGALKRDWAKAVQFTGGQRASATGTGKWMRHDRNSYTSASPTQGGGEKPGSGLSVFDFIRTWRNALALYEEQLAGERWGLVARMVLRSLGEAASKTGSIRVEFGVRSVAIASGVHHTTAARHLRELARGDDAMIRLIEEAHGTKGDLYELVIPEQLAEEARTRRWKKGKVHALRPVFRELGIVAAFAYEAIEQNDSMLTSAAVARTSKLSTTAVNEALEALAAWNMVARTDGRWHVVKSTSLSSLAQVFGVDEEVAAQVAQYRRDRYEWRQWLELRHTFGSAHVPDDDYPYWLFEPPPDDEATLVGAMTGFGTPAGG